MVSDEFKVRLDRVFQGPMDLLLHLVREQEVEITEIDIHRVIEGYLAYVRQLSTLDIEVAGEFLVMAASLMAIKSRSLLPREEVDLEDELDPRDELIERLIEYRRFKEASDDLGDRYSTRQRQFDRGTAPEADGVNVEITLDMGELTAWDLLATFSRLMRETLADRPHRVTGDARPLRYYVASLATRMRGQKTSSLRSLVRETEAEPSREILVGTFCALLELIRMGVIVARQDEITEDISIEYTGGQGEEELDSLISSTHFDDEAVGEEEGGEAEGGEAEGNEDASEAGAEAEQAPTQN